MRAQKAVLQVQDTKQVLPDTPRSLPVPLRLVAQRESRGVEPAVNPPGRAAESPVRSACT